MEINVTDKDEATITAGVMRLSSIYNDVEVWRQEGKTTIVCSKKKNPEGPAPPIAG